MTIPEGGKSMPQKLRVAAFNVENLFARFRFKGKRERYQKPDGGYGYRYREYTAEELHQAVKDGWIVDKTFFAIHDERSKEITAKAIRAVKADVIALQEVESLDTLKRFNRQYRLGYRYSLLIDGNDPRLIDVAVLSKHPFGDVRTHQFETSGRSFVFSRDCLEVEIQLSQHTFLPVFVNHFKSMIGGRKETMPRRRAQAQRVVKILKERFGNRLAQEAFIVLGDLNDYLPSSGLAPLLSQPWLENVVQTRIADSKERWTHYYAGENEYRQLDYLLLSKALADANPQAVPRIERRGMPRRAQEAGKERFEGVGRNYPKASDHCPVVIEIQI
jgi:endonuclease/exonuclease/phosphatase family metal-dependent hydrolase